MQDKKPSVGGVGIFSGTAHCRFGQTSASPNFSQAMPQKQDEMKVVQLICHIFVFYSGPEIGALS